MTKLREIEGDNEVYYSVKVISHKKNMKTIEIHAEQNSMLAIDDLTFDRSGGCCEADLDEDGVVGLGDFSKLADCWLAETR